MPTSTMTGQGQSPARTTVGVTNVEVLERDEAQASGALAGNRQSRRPADSALIRVTINETAPPDFVALDRQLKKSVSGASCDTHSGWKRSHPHGPALSTLSYAILPSIAILGNRHG